MFRGWALLRAMVGLVVGLGAPAICVGAQKGRSALTCTNPLSGASWRIVIDFRQSTVDAHPAEITRSEISWFDPKDGGHYTLDRKTGDLSATVASSTGGYFRRAHCALGRSR